MTVSEYIFDFLQKKGLKTVYMVSGSSAMWLTDALKNNERLQAVCCHHEQAAAMAAACYGRVGGVPGACLVTIGPGATNAITGVAGAYVDSCPMFVLSGQANSRILQYQIDTGIRQKGTQSLNLEPLVSSIVKYFAAVMDPKDIRYHMERAYFEAMNGRKGPVWLDVPVDIQNRQVPDELEMEGFIVPEQVCEDFDIFEIVNMIKIAKKPLILAGYGVRSAGASDMLKAFSAKYQIPVVTSRGGIDVIESDHPLFVGRPGSYGDRASHFAIQNCDLLFILGSRLAVSTIGYYPERLAGEAKKIMVDIDTKELDKNDVSVDIKLCYDVKSFLEKMLAAEAKVMMDDRMEWLEFCLNNKKKYPVVQEEYRQEHPINSYHFTELLTEQVPENTNIIVDTGSVCNIVSQTWKIKRGQNYIISGGLSSMGFWAASIGAAAMSDKVIALAGDGSAHMNIQELATLKYNDLPIKLFVYNNHGYLLIRHNQHNYMNDRFLGVGPDSGLEMPDFCAVACAYGIKAVRISNREEIADKVHEVLTYDGPVVCEVMVQEFGIIAPRIASRVMPDGTLKAAEFDDLWPFLDKE
ncbi:Acetolactate synthase large subunit [Dehalobacter sp. UNSWDHB]|jgi:Thiamine pyrophosphate-requiring enzymes [acetolactate synthase, pyruvate dehydrogenase (cytochrome), glyoxylate carboligase, phosphonopyruvate decarboxylase]|uniref:thiamine pyrophosphate-binding protein n=1 Tax=unclassified Dehalobacter TaxID=2635733 RepID=UPI00028B8856|nr:MULTISPECIES: thiamine pyrophosphate-binding protein [unclassified Dehalobacter]AFV02584.1 Acetolactate synthase large subunit [Dehalobacter sp. DCA]AFV05570.1 Acetolactate synthase large subunit [Dehalobacter sp. CF]EQB21711.1 Acetolactate synthase large subunit [Dehalobacter sp. UNSWDHB]